MPIRFWVVIALTGLQFLIFLALVYIAVHS